MNTDAPTKARSKVLAHRQYLFKRLTIRQKVMKAFLASSPEALDSHPILLTSLDNALKQVSHATKQWRKLVRMEAQRQRSNRSPSPEAEEAKTGKGAGKSLVQADKALAVAIANMQMFLEATPSLQQLHVELMRWPDHFLSCADVV